MAGQVDGADGTLVHEEDDLAPRAREGWPIAGEHGRVERFILAANVIWRDHFVRLKDRPYFCIESVEGSGCERLWLSQVKLAMRFALLRFNENENRYVIGMGLRPLPNDLEAAGKGLA